MTMLDTIRQIADNPDPFRAAHDARGPSPINFRVTETPLYFDSNIPGQRRIESPKHKQLWRTHNDGTGAYPVPLNVVGNGYKVLQNIDLFKSIENGLRDNVAYDKLHGLQIKDSSAYNGAECYREYIFPATTVRMRESEVAFRVIVVNGFGRSAVTVAAGAIDFFCTNGMMTGHAEKIIKKHTSGLTTEGITSYIVGQMSMFADNAQQWIEWHNKPLTSEMVDAFFDRLIEEGRMSKRYVNKLRGRALAEFADRGMTKWALYSAMTYGATHTHDDDFKPKDTGEDTAASVQYQRALDVMKITQTKAFAEVGNG